MEYGISMYGIIIVHIKIFFQKNLNLKMIYSKLKKNNKKISNCNYNNTKTI